MFALVQVGLLIGIRSQVFKVVWVLTFALIILALFASTFSGRQPMTVGLDVGISFFRTVLLLMVLMWSQLLLANEIERKTLYFMLAYPFSRSQYLLARFLSLALLTLFAVMILGFLLWGALKLANWSYTGEALPELDWRYLLMLLGIWLDLLLVLAFTILLCSLSTTPFLPFFVGIAFALAARGLGPTFDYLRQSALADPDQVQLLSPILEYAYLWLPDLSRLDWRVPVLYNLPFDASAAGMAVLMAAGYCIAMLCVACVIFERRNFV